MPRPWPGKNGIRHYIDGEEEVRAFLAAHFGMAGQFVIHTERESSKGCADLYPEPFVTQYPDIGYGYAVAFKYLKRSGRMEESAVGETLHGASATP